MSRVAKGLPNEFFFIPYSVHRRGIFLSLFSLMLGLGVMFTADCSSTTDRIKCFKKGVADLYSGRVASMAVVLSCSSIPPRRPGEEICRPGGRNPGEIQVRQEFFG